MKGDIRRLNDKIEAVDLKHSARFDSLQQQLSALTLAMERGFARLDNARERDRIWWLVICATLLGVMARGFKWL